MCNRIVKTFIYTQLIVSCVFLWSGCSQSNRFGNDTLRQVHTFADERKNDVVIDYLDNESDDIRAHACLLLGSMTDSLAIAPLLHAMEFDKSEDVRAAASFALGQYQMDGLVNLMLRWLLEEKSDGVKQELLRAIGKSGGGKSLLKYRKEIPENLNDALAEGLFYSIRKQPDQLDLLPWLIELLAEEDDIRFYAASAIARLKGDISASREVLKKYATSEENVDTRAIILKCLSSSGEADAVFLNQLFDQEKAYLCRLFIIRGIHSWKGASEKSLILKALADTDFHVRETAADYVLAHADLFSVDELEKLATNEQHARAKYTLFEACLVRSDATAAQKISAILLIKYSKEQDEYVRGFILKALSADWNNLGFLEEECFNTTSILVREFSFEALLKIRSDKRFSLYAEAWKKTSAVQTLEEHFAKVIRDGIATYDVSLVALGAAYLRDTTLPGSLKSVYTIPFMDLGFLEEALEKMRLPRDIESYGELLKTMRFLEGKPVYGDLKPEFNHPIDWDLVERIPENQHIAIETEAGTIEAELWVNDAPGTVANFVKLIQDSFYMNKRLHRVVPGFVIQDGCPRGDGYGSTMETIRSEFTHRRFDAGVLGMASAGTDTESCQWFITHTRTPHLNGRYTAFGRVTQGMEIVHLLGIGAKIKQIRLLAN